MGSTMGAQGKTMISDYLVNACQCSDECKRGAQLTAQLDLARHVFQETAEIRRAQRESTKGLNFLLGLESQITKLRVTNGNTYLCMTRYRTRNRFPFTNTLFLDEFHGSVEFVQLEEMGTIFPLGTIITFMFHRHQSGASDGRWWSDLGWITSGKDKK